MESNEILKISNEYEPKAMKGFYPMIWKEAKDDIVIDFNNKKYIDFTSTVFVMNIGHSNKRVKKYIKKQINSNLLHSYIFNNEIRAKFIDELIKITPSFCQKAFLVSSGTEAIETAVKLMRLYGDKKIIISFKGAMHGRTMASELLKGSSYYNHPEFVNLNFPQNNSNFLKDINNLKIDTKKICGFMIETYQGWSAKFLPILYIKDLINFAHKNHSLVCFDEIQAGFGRTGKMFGFEHYEIEPDLICIGKAIGNGLPLSGVLGRKEILDIPREGEMSSTHSANPLCCSAGLAVLDEFEKQKIVEQSYKKGIYLLERLNNIKNKIIIEINCKGLVAGLIFNDKQIANNICLNAFKKGLLLVHTGRESIKIGPPLIISNKNLKKGMDILEKVINDYPN